jgi:hypothetical protein
VGDGKAKVNEGNNEYVPVRHAFERLGAVQEGVLRKHIGLWDGYIRDTVYYSVIESEWRDIKHCLEGLPGKEASGLTVQPSCAKDLYYLLEGVWQWLVRCSARIIALT